MQTISILQLIERKSKQTKSFKSDQRIFTTVINGSNDSGVITLEEIALSIASSGEGALLKLLLLWFSKIPSFKLTGDRI